jgi:hypothetical protein
MLKAQHCIRVYSSLLHLLDPGNQLQSLVASGPGAEHQAADRWAAVGSARQQLHSRLKIQHS